MIVNKIKRTYEQSLTFFKHKTDKRGDGRELYKTPKQLIRAIVSDLLCVFPNLKNYEWVDPCASDGVWGEVISEFGINCISFDIQPMSDKVIKKDFFETNDTNKFYIGNPPFSLAKKFVNHSLKNGNICYFLGGSQLITGSLSTRQNLFIDLKDLKGIKKISVLKLFLKILLKRMC